MTLLLNSTVDSFELHDSGLLQRDTRPTLSFCSFVLCDLLGVARKEVKISV